MKQIIQSLKTGEVELIDVATPKASSGTLVIKTTKSLVSLGTEKMMLDFGKANWVSKAKQQPDKVKMVLDKVKTDGLIPTINAVNSKINAPIPLGYSNVGVVLEVGSNIKDFKVGDRVISNGHHAEVVKVPENLCAKIPDNVSDEEAAFTIVSAIGLQGIRLADPTLGETFVVIGLGLIGLITCQILKANGCQVIGLDLSEEKVNIAKKYGVHAFVSNPEADIDTVLKLTDYQGADGVIITAATSSNGPIEMAPKICRHRGRVVLVGVIGLELNRTEFFKKEISFQVSCSYGPGRYDSNYEDKGYDYPIGFVRWTENRNFKAILNLISENKLYVKELITKNVEFAQTPEMYKNLNSNLKELGILINYPKEIRLDDKIEHFQTAIKPSQSSKTLGFIGAGNFTSQVLLPSFKKEQFDINIISSSKGLSGSLLSQKFQIPNTTTDNEVIFNDNNISSVAITTPHSSHGKLTLKALQSNKNVFVEKPLCLKRSELDEIKEYCSSQKNIPLLMVGFNRRFSPLVEKLKERLNSMSEPMSIIMTINAGYIPSNHWTQDKDIGGGRLLGEGCHFIDLARFLVGKKITSYSINAIDSESKDTFTILLKFEDSSIATINYFSNGNKSIAKEFIQVFCQKYIMEIDNFKSLKIHSPTGKKEKIKTSSQDKGHNAEAKAFLKALRSGVPAIDINEIFEVTQITIDLDEQLHS